MPPVGPQLPQEQQHGSLPGALAHTLAGHDGPVLAVRFNEAGTYCLSAGRVRPFSMPCLCLFLCRTSVCVPLEPGGCRP